MCYFHHQAIFKIKIKTTVLKADKFIVAASTLSDQQPHGPEVARDANCDTRPRAGGPKAPIGQT